MKHIFNKFSNSKSVVVTHINSGSNYFNIIPKGTDFSGILNGYEIIEIPSSKKASEKVQYVMADLLKNLIEPKNSSVIIFNTPDKSPTDLKFLNSIKLQEMPNNLSEVRKTLNPDFNIEKAINYNRIKKGLMEFTGAIKNLSNALTCCREDALALTQSRMIDSMWGAKEMQKILDSIRFEIANNEAWEKSEFYESMILKSLQRLFHKLDTDLMKRCLEENKMISGIVIPNILNNYEKIKKIAMDSLYSLAPLINIDEKFREKTSYPATMFLKSSMFENLNEDYDRILKFIVDIPSLEESVIYPLDFMRIQFSTN